MVTEDGFRTINYKEKVTYGLNLRDMMTFSLEFSV